MNGESMQTKEQPLQLFQRKSVTGFQTGLCSDQGELVPVQPAAVGAAAEL